MRGQGWLQQIIGVDEVREEACDGLKGMSEIRGELPLVQPNKE